ncbi:hypothetical protein [Leucobacter sp. M11]|nr:hypothetical protein [Leucobacter sp. M11]
MLERHLRRTIALRNERLAALTRAQVAELIGRDPDERLAGTEKPPAV